MRKDYNHCVLSIPRDSIEMNSLIIFVCVIATAWGASLTSSRDAHVIRYDNDNNGVGGYNFGYETSDGINRQETAELKYAGSEQESLSVKGSYSFVADDGQHYVVNYIADDNGFQPQGSHIPS